MGVQIGQLVSAFIQSVCRGNAEVMQGLFIFGNAVCAAAIVEDVAQGVGILGVVRFFVELQNAVPGCGPVAFVQAVSAVAGIALKVKRCFVSLFAELVGYLPGKDKFPVRSFLYPVVALERLDIVFLFLTGKDPFSDGPALIGSISFKVCKNRIQIQGLGYVFFVPEV